MTATDGSSTTDPVAPVEIGADAAGAGASPTSTPVRPTHGIDAALRVSVLGPGGQVDLVVPYGNSVGDLAAAYAGAVGSAAAPGLTLPGGRALDGAAVVDDVLDQGDLLLVRSGGEAPAATEDDPQEWGRESTSLAGSTARPVLVLAASVALAAVGAAVAGTPAVASAGAPGWPRPTAAAVLLVGALLVALHASRAGTARGHAYAAAPALAAAAGFGIGWSPGAGGVLLGLAVAGLAAGVVAALARSGAEVEGSQLLRAWLWVGTAAAAAAIVWLLLGAGLLGFATVALAVAVVATRMLPGFAVDVDDDVLLDLDRLAVTAWSAREAPRGGRKRHQVPVASVRDVVAGSRRAVTAGVLAAVVVAAASAPVVLVGAGAVRTPWAHAGGLAMVALGGATVGLVARTYRSRLPRLLLGLTSCWLLLLAGAALATTLQGRWLWWAFAVLAVAVPGVVMAAVRLGNGWRSVWWSRTGEVLQTLTGVFVLALVPLASGLFDVIRTSFG